MRMSVTAPDGKLVNVSGPVMEGSRLVEQLKKSTVRGTYAISFRIMSDDGHPVSGTVHFTVSSVPVKPAMKAAGASGTPSGDDGTWVAVAAGALVVGSGLAVGFAVRRRRASVAVG
jgi:hypothetical protein